MGWSIAGTDRQFSSSVHVSSVRAAGFLCREGFKFQVSEFVKIVLVLLVARYLTELKTE